MVGLLSLHPLFLSIHEKKEGLIKEEEISSSKKEEGKEEREGEREGQIISAGDRDARTTLSSVSTVFSSSSNSVCKSHAKTVLDQLSESTFDFGVVAVYSCPNSCSMTSNDNNCHNDDVKSNKDNSRGISENMSTSYDSTASGSAGQVCYEYIVVQPPSDF